MNLYKSKRLQIDCASHGAIGLISLDSKVYAKVLARRIQERSERPNKRSWEVQGDFRPRRGCMDQIFSLCIITDKFLAVLWT